MAWFTMYVIFLIILSLLSLLSFVYFSRLKNKLSATLGIFSLLNALYTIGNLGLLLAKNEQQTMLFFELTAFGGFVLLPLFVYAIYIISDLLNNKRTFVFIALFISFFFFFMFHTNEYHELYFSSINIESVGYYNVITVEYGLFYYLEAIYRLILLALSGYLIYNLYTRNNRFLKVFAILLLSGMGLFLIFKLLSVFSPLNINLVPIATSVGIAFYIYAAKKSDLFYFFEVDQHLSPEFRTGIFVIDEKNSLLYFNSIAYTLLPWLTVNNIGDNISTLPLIKLNLKGEGDSVSIYENNYDDKQKFFLFKRYELPKKNALYSSFYIFNDFTEQVAVRKELEFSASRDGLTKIYNQVSILNLAEKSFDSAKTNKKLFSITIIDVDNFKIVNDRYGHVFGNSVLVDIANTIAEYFQNTSCSYGRFGGDEFLIVCENCNKDKHQEKLALLVNKISEMSNERLDNLELSLSVGTHFVDFSNNETSETYLEALEIADKRMYEDKAKNKKKH